MTTQVLELLDAKSTAVVAQAALVLGSLRHRGSVPALCELVRSHASIEVKRQAMAALCKIRDKQSVATSIFALESADGVVRTSAAKNLGYLHARQAAHKLLEVIATDPTPDAPDRIAALLALADIGVPSCLVPAAARVKGSGKEEQKALVYLFQTLSPKLDAKREGEVMIAVLDDDSELLRRYAIQRLGILKIPETAVALKARLPKEKALRGLIEVSLKVIREDQTAARLQNYVSKAGQRGRELWQSLPAHFLYGVAAGGILLLILTRSVRRRRHRSRAAERAAAMVAPSEGFQGEADYDDDYAEEGYDDAEEDYDDVEDYPAPNLRRRGRYGKSQPPRDNYDEYDPGYDDDWEGNEDGYLGDDPFDEYYGDDEIITDEREFHR